jgi:Skp family chaperone for outer membrane proteins
MESQQQAIRADQEQREKQFQQMQQDIEALRAGSQAYLDQMEAIEAYAIESRVAVETAQARLKRQHRQATHEMMSIIQQTIAAVAAEQGYTVVLHRGRLDLNEEPAQQLASPHVLYATDAVDITGAIVARLNEQYDAQQAQ